MNVDVTLKDKIQPDVQIYKFLLKGEYIFVSWVTGTICIFDCPCMYALLEDKNL